MNFYSVEGVPVYVLVVLLLTIPSSRVFTRIELHTLPRRVTSIKTAYEVQVKK